MGRLVCLFGNKTKTIMYEFQLLNLDSVDIQEYEHYQNKNLFTTVSWLRFLHEWKKVTPIIIRISDENNSLVGHFTGCTFRIFNFLILGSPFYGWMGQHMGFDFENVEIVEKTKVLDEIIIFLIKQIKISFIILADFQFVKDDVKACKTRLFYDNIRGSFFLDLTQSEDQLFKNFKSGYRTCVRKFEKMGGTIVEDMSVDFIEEHHKQLLEVFNRKYLSSPNYRDRMKLLFEKYPEMVLSIKALDDKQNNIASSYYLGAGSMSFFASNASLTGALNYNANQALMWYAIKYWKEKGIKTLDFAGRSSYKENFGPTLKNTPTIVWAKHTWQYNLIMSARNAYYKTFRIKFIINEIFHKIKTA